MTNNETYYNTTRLSGAELQTAVSEARGQEELIMELFKIKADRTPSELYNALGCRYPITSIRRAVTNLTNAFVLIKTEAQKTGIYGKPEHVWTLPEPDIESPK